MLGVAVHPSGAAAPLRVGVYQPAAGGQGLLTALTAAPEVEARPLEALSAGNLFVNDVVVIGSLKGLAAGQESWRRDLRLFVRAGGGLLLEHDACGFRGWEENVREWFGAKSLARACVLTHQMGLLLRHKDPREAWQREWGLFEQLSQFQDLDMMLSAETRFYPSYRALLAPAESLLNVSSATFEGLRSYLAAGGVVFSLGGRWRQSRPDFTQEQDVTADFLGGAYADRKALVDSLQPAGAEAKLIPIAPQEVSPFEPKDPGVKVLASFAQGGPAVTEFAVGQGQVVAFHFDVAAEVSAHGPETLQYLATLVAAATAPEIQSDGTLRMMTTLRKNNWVAATLYADSAPATGTVKVDIQRLGGQAPFYRVYLYGRNRELEAPGGYWYPKLWTASQIAAGIAVTIPRMGCLDLDLPDTFDFTGFPKEEQDWIQAVLPSRWKDYRALRRWDHEILVVAPYDELNMEGEKAGTAP